jgi:hypothetical protein
MSHRRTRTAGGGGNGGVSGEIQGRKGSTGKKEQKR